MISAITQFSTTYQTIRLRTVPMSTALDATTKDRGRNWNLGIALDKETSLDRHWSSESVFRRIALMLQKDVKRIVLTSNVTLHDTV